MTLPGFSTLTPCTGLGCGRAEPTCVCGPSSGFASDSGLQDIGDGQATQRSLRTYTDSSWVQGTVARHAPIAGVLDPHFGQLGQVGMSSENSTMNADCGNTDHHPALDTLAAAAHQQRSQETLQPFINERCSNLVSKPNGAQHVRPTATGAQLSSSYAAESNATASDRNITIGHTSQRSWQPVDPSWPQEPVAPETAYRGATNPSPDGYGAGDDWDTMVKNLYAVWR